MINMKKYTIILIAGIAIVVTSAFDILSENGKAGYTGSPNELLCNDCHDTYGNSNSGTGTIYVTSNMNNWQYVPGQTYTVNVIVKQMGRPLFGLGFEALNASNANAGSIQVVNTAKTQIKTKTINGVTRNNLVHQMWGGLSNDSAVFTFNWVAPATNIGNVTFYFSGVAANNNGDEFSDYVYNNSKLVTPASATALPEVTSTGKSLKGFINAEGTIMLEYMATEPAQPRVDVYDLQGRLISSRLHENQQSGTVKLAVERPIGLKEGLYVIAVLAGADVYSTKIQLK